MKKRESRVHFQPCKSEISVKNLSKDDINDLKSLLRIGKPVSQSQKNKSINVVQGSPYNVLQLNQQNDSKRQQKVSEVNQIIGEEKLQGEKSLTKWIQLKRLPYEPSEQDISIFEEDELEIQNTNKKGDGFSSRIIKLNQLIIVQPVFVELMSFSKKQFQQYLNKLVTQELIEQEQQEKALSKTENRQFLAKAKYDLERLDWKEQWQIISSRIIKRQTKIFTTQDQDNDEYEGPELNTQVYNFYTKPQVQKNTTALNIIKNNPNDIQKKLSEKFVGKVKTQYNENIVNQNGNELNKSDGKKKRGRPRKVKVQGEIEQRGEKKEKNMKDMMLQDAMESLKKELLIGHSMMGQLRQGEGNKDQERKQIKRLNREQIDQNGIEDDRQAIKGECSNFRQREEYQNSFNGLRNFQESEKNTHYDGQNYEQMQYRDYYNFRSQFSINKDRMLGYGSEMQQQKSEINQQQLLEQIEQQWQNWQNI